MKYETDVEVVTVTQATDVISGDLVYQIGLGKTGKPYPGVAGSQVKKISSNVLVIFMPIEGECPYIVGSHWSLSIANDGTLNLKRMKSR
jgi:hypothetical protein